MGRVLEEFGGLRVCSALRPGALGEGGDLGAVDNEGVAVLLSQARTSSWTQLWDVGEVWFA